MDSIKIFSFKPIPSGVPVTVYRSGTENLVDIYADPEKINLLENPFIHEGGTLQIYSANNKVDVKIGPSPIYNNNVELWLRGFILNDPDDSLNDTGELLSSLLEQHNSNSNSHENLSHISNTGNPHNVTAYQCGATPLSHLTDYNNPHQLTPEKINATPNTHLTDNNPHNITPEMIGAASSTIANNLDAHLAASNPHNITPTLINAASKSDLNLHIINTNNPHNLTPSKIGAEVAGAASIVQTDLNNHKNNTSNPHAVTAAQVGAEPANSNIQSHISNNSNPHNVTASQLTDFNTVFDNRLNTIKATPNGLATLDSNGKLIFSQIPAIALTNVTVISSESEQLSLEAQEGDVVIRTDLEKSYIKNNETTGTMTDWTELSSNGQVLSVNNQVGVVNLTYSDVGASPTNHKHSSDQLNTINIGPFASEQTLIDSFSTFDYRCMKYIISLEDIDSNCVYASEVLVTHNGSLAFFNEYSVLSTFIDVNPTIIVELDRDLNLIELTIQNNSQNNYVSLQRISTKTMNSSLLGDITPANDLYPSDNLLPT